MKTLLSILAILSIAAACNKEPREEFTQKQQEANKDYREEVRDAAQDRNEEMKDASEDLREEQKEEAEDYVEDSDNATIDQSGNKVDVDESREQMKDEMNDNE